MFQEVLFCVLVSSTNLSLKVVPIEAEQHLCKVITFCTKNRSFLKVLCVLREVKTERKTLEIMEKVFVDFSHFSIVPVQRKQK